MRLRTISHLREDCWIIKRVPLNQVFKIILLETTWLPECPWGHSTESVRGSWNRFLFLFLFFFFFTTHFPQLRLLNNALNLCGLPHSHSYLTRRTVLAVWIHTDVAHPGGQIKSWRQLSGFLLACLSSPSVGNNPPERVGGYYNKLDVSCLHFSPPKKKKKALEHLISAHIMAISCYISSRMWLESAGWCTASSDHMIAR